MFENRFVNRVLHKLAAAVLLPACVLWGGWQAWERHAQPGAAATPATPSAGPSFNRAGHEAQDAAALLPAFTAAGAMPAPAVRLRPLPLGEVEQRFARRFPGSLERLTDGQQVLVLREVREPTRLLHPAADCYQGLGYRIAAQRLEQDARERLWRCFEARRGAQALRVCERIVDAQGQGFTDASAWYWSAALGRSQGPWQAVTVARPL